MNGSRVGRTLRKAFCLGVAVLLVLASSSPDGLIARVQERARRVEAGHDR